MTEMKLKTSIEVKTLRGVYDYLDKDPKENIPKLLGRIDSLLPNGLSSKQRQLIKEIASDPENNWYRLVMSLWDDIDSGVRRAAFENFVLNGVLKWCSTHDDLMNKYGCNIPWAILFDPTSACNLHCTGCWAAEYGNRLNLSFEQMDSIISQGKELGVHFYLFTGGEPLVRKKDIIKLCEKHSDCEFLSFTNGTLIDEAFADEMLRVKNFIPAISVEGFEADTDFRRGDGTYKHVVEAMRILREKKLPFGISCCYTSKNVEVIGSEEYYDWMVEQGAKFCWFFTYMPVGANAVPELMATAQQRKFMYEQVRRFRNTKPIFTLDFWNDGEFCGGCIAGGRRYLHINANGDYEPCAFIHYSDSNIKDKTLLEALQSPLFMEYRSHQPFNKNHLRPCPLLDNPGKLTEMVKNSGAHSTDLEEPEDVELLSEKCESRAADWAVTAGEIWAKYGREVKFKP